MSLNKFMHSRNIYRKKKDYAELGAKYPELNKHLIRFDNGNATIDFKNAEALRALTITLLQEDFNLMVTLPSDRLIPAVPQRLNYMLWVEDLVALLNKSRLITCLDIGCGASCILPLIGIRNNPRWQFVATELDQASFESARDNVARNGLEDKVKVIKGEPNTTFNDLLQQYPNITVTMCNPPFFNLKDTVEEVNPARTPSPANMAQSVETKVEGGEFEYIKQMLFDSANVGSQIAIFTTMIGRKVSLKELKKCIHEGGLDIKSFTTGEFCQGKTIRWGLAWTFRADVDLDKSRKLKHRSTKAPLKYPLPYTMKAIEYTLGAVTEKVKGLLAEDLNLSGYDVIRETVHTTEIWITTNINTWSNQRRKRRQQMRVNNNSSGSEDMSTSPSKRKHETSTEESSFEESIVEQKRLKDDCTASESLKDEELYLLHCALILKQKNKQIVLKVVEKDKCRDREAPHQILQYFKNKLI